jgi:quinol monooxygenase YgiN
MAPMRSSANDPWRATISVHLRVRVVEERQGEFRSFLREAIPFYEAPGGIRVRLLQDESDPERFIELVEYADEHAYRQDDERVQSDATMAQFLARWRALLTEAPTVEIYRDVDLPG